MGKPKIRFKGYTEDWEQRKFDDLADYKKGPFGSALKKDMFVPKSDMTVKVYEQQNAINKDWHLERYFITEEYANKLSGFRVEGGDIIVSCAGTIGETYEIPLDAEPGIINQALMRIKVKESIVNKKMFNILFTNMINDFTRVHSNGSAIKNIPPFSDLKPMVVFVPKMDEQNKISSYFSNLDHLITLHQRKCDETKKLKKCMLQKMFPKEGEKVPEIRFSGFTGDWKQRKLGEIVNRITRKNSKLISELPLTISAQQGLIDQNEFFDKRVASKDVSGYYLIKNGEFAYNRSTSNDAPWGAIKRLDRYENGVLSTLYIVFEIKDETLVNSDFLVAYYNTNLWHKGIHEIAAEGARNHGLLNIAPTDFFKTKLKLPADIEEQQEIGEYFKKIDSLITFHHRKLNILNKICRYAWEQRKVLDLLIQPITDGPHETPKLVEKGVPFISVDAIVDNKIDFNRKRGNISEEYDELCCKKYKPQFHDVYLVKSGSTVGKVAIVETTDRFNIWSPLAAMRCGEKTYPYFLYDLLQTKDLQAQVADKASNGTQPNLSMRELEKFPVSVPSNLEEQKKIGDYFRSLDHLITLHQQKCKQLQIIRKFMLKNMFL